MKRVHGKGTLLNVQNVIKEMQIKIRIQLCLLMTWQTSEGFVTTAR